MHIEEYDFEKFREFYKEIMIIDFTEEELRPLNIVENLYKNGLYTCYVLVDLGTILGYLVLAKGKNTGSQLLEYFSINPKFRKIGIGSRLLKNFLEMVDERVYLEVEDPDFALDLKDRRVREKRVAFYEKNGIKSSTLLTNLYGGTYRIMYKLPFHPTLEDQKELLSDEEIRRDLELIYENLLSRATKERGDIFVSASSRIEQLTPFNFEHFRSQTHSGDASYGS